MIKNVIFTLLTIFLFGCKSLSQNKDVWTNAQWIGLEKIPDSLVIVPGIHGLKKGFEGKYKKRSIKVARDAIFDPKNDYYKSQAERSAAFGKAVRAISQTKIDNATTDQERKRLFMKKAMDAINSGTYKSEKERMLARHQIARGL